MSAGLPEVQDVRRIEARPGDRFVVTVRDGMLISQADAADIKEQVGSVLNVGTERILVMAGADLTVISPDAGPPRAAEGSAPGGPVPGNPLKETT